MSYPGGTVGGGVPEFNEANRRYVEECNRRAHTPGPWHFEPLTKTQFNIEGEPPHHWLATVHDGNGDHPAEANARLIAGALEGEIISPADLLLMVK